MQKHDGILPGAYIGFDTNGHLVGIVRLISTREVSGAVSRKALVHFLAFPNRRVPDSDGMPDDIFEPTRTYAVADNEFDLLEEAYQHKTNLKLETGIGNIIWLDKFADWQSAADFVVSIATSFRIRMQDYYQ